MSTLVAEPKQDNLQEEQQIPDRRLRSDVDQIEDSLGNDYVSGAPLLLSLLVVGLATVLVGYDANCVTTIIPLVTDTFNSLNDVGWYGSSFLLASAASQLFYGKIYRFWSTRIVFSVVVLIFALGNLICALSRSSAVFTVGRAVSGLGSAGVLSGTIIIISRVAPVKRRPVCLGVIGALESSAIAVGPLLGGLVADTLGWRWCFWLCLPLAGITVLIAMVVLRDSIPSEESSLSLSGKLRQLDLASMAIFVPSVVCLILALQWGGSRYPWSSWRIVLLFVLSFCLLMAFAGLQWRNGDDATVPPKVFLARTVCFGALYSFNTSGSLSVILYYLPIWFQAIKGTSALVSGIWGLPLVISLTLAVLASGVITPFIGYYNPSMYAGTALMCAGAGMMAVLSSTSREPFWISCQIIFALGAGLGFQQPIIAVQTNFFGKDLPTALVLISFIQTIGGVVALSAAQNVFSNRLAASLRRLMPDAGDTDLILNTGILNMKSAFGAEEFEKVIMPAYNLSVTRVFLVATAMAAVTTIGSIGVPWRSLRAKAAVEAAV